MNEPEFEVKYHSCNLCRAQYALIKRRSQNSLSYDFRRRAGKQGEISAEFGKKFAHYLEKLQKIANAKSMVVATSDDVDSALHI